LGERLTIRLSKKKKKLNPYAEHQYHKVIV